VVVTRHKHPAATSLVDIAPFGLMLFAILIRIALHFHEMSFPLLIGYHQVREEQAAM
jgi:hypothetical protein